MKQEGFLWSPVSFAGVYLQAGFCFCSMLLCFLSLLMTTWVGTKLQFCPGHWMYLGLVGVTVVGKMFAVKREPFFCVWWPLCLRCLRSSPSNQQFFIGHGAWFSELLNTSALQNALHSSFAGSDPCLTQYMMHSSPDLRSHLPCTKKKSDISIKREYLYLFAGWVLLKSDVILVRFCHW